MAKTTLSQTSPKVQSVFSELKSLVATAFSKPHSILAQGGARVTWYSVHGDYVEFSFTKVLTVYKLSNAELRELATLLAQDAHEVFPGVHYDYWRVWGTDAVTHDVRLTIELNDTVYEAEVRLDYIVSLTCVNAGNAKGLPKAELKSTWSPDYPETKEYWEVKRFIEGYLFSEEPAKLLNDVTVEVFAVDDRRLFIALRGYVGSVEVPEKLYPDIKVWLEHTNLFDVNASTPETLQFATVVEPYDNVIEERRLYTTYDPDEQVLRFYARIFLSFWCPDQ